MSDTERLEILLPKHINMELVNLASKANVSRAHIMREGYVAVWELLGIYYMTKPKEMRAALNAFKSRHPNLFPPGETYGKPPEEPTGNHRSR